MFRFVASSAPSLAMTHSTVYRQQYSIRIKSDERQQHQKKCTYYLWGCVVSVAFIIVHDVLFNVVVTAIFVVKRAK